MLSHSEINDIAVKLLSLRNKKTESLYDNLLLQREEFKLLGQLKFLIGKRLFKYYSFDNCPDLEQDAYLALLDAVKTFQPQKGNFLSWADLYIKTKLSRSANKHPTLKIPISQVKKHKPMKIDLEFLKNYEEGLLNPEQKMLLKYDFELAINSLSDLHIQMLRWVSEFPLNFIKMSKSFNIPVNKLKQNWKEIKNILEEYV